jgi:hypothetical protein
MIYGRLKFHASREAMFGPDISIWMHSCLNVNGVESIAVPDPLQMRTLTPVERVSGEYRPPFLSLSREDGQQLMDELWYVGLRPSEGSGSAGSLAATQRHLDDMRALVFKQTPKNL